MPQRFYEYCVQRAVFAQQVERHAAHGDPRNEVGDIRNRLNHPFRPAVFHFVQKQREHQDQGKIGADSNQRYVNGIAEHPVRASDLRVKNLSERFHSDKFAAEHAVQNLIILKRDHQPEHGQIAENQHVQKCGKQ